MVKKKRDNAIKNGVYIRTRADTDINDTRFGQLINPLPDMPIVGFSNSAANKDMMSNICTI